MVVKSRTFRAPAWVRALIGLAAAFSIAAAAELIAKSAPLWQVSLLSLLALWFSVGLIESLTSRIVLSPAALQVTSNFKTKSVPRDEITAVQALKGVSVAVQLQSGGWLVLPSYLGSADANTIRAWIRAAKDMELDVGQNTSADGRGGAA